MSGDEEFDDFLARRKPLFRRATAHELEPPEDVDRLVLRQAREAIKPAKHLEEIRGPGWGMPLALAATVLITVTIVLNVMVPKKAGHASADIHQVAQRVDSPAPGETSAPAAAEQSATAKTAASPAWRRDGQSWLAEIDKLRAEGKNAEADAEMAEYKRQHRAYASGPDR